GKRALTMDSEKILIPSMKGRHPSLSPILVVSTQKPGAISCASTQGPVSHALQTRCEHCRLDRHMASRTGPRRKRTPPIRGRARSSDGSLHKSLMKTNRKYQLRERPTAERN